MKQSMLEFWKKVCNTTFCAFFFVTMTYIGLQSMMLLLDEQGTPTTDLQAFGYLFIKMALCIVPFSFCLGLAARIFDTKKPRAYQRMLHFFACFAAYLIFMDLIFNNTNSVVFGDIEDKVLVSKYIKDTIPFFVLYPITAGITAMGRAIFVSKESHSGVEGNKKKKKSILD